MNIIQNHRIASYLIFGSLLLLLAFQSMWLKASYEQAKEELRANADQVFLEAVREIEDSMLRIAISNPLDFFCNDSISFSDLQFALGINPEGIDTLTPIFESANNQNNPAHLDATGSGVNLRTDLSASRRHKRFGSLSFFMATTDSVDYNSPFLEVCQENDPTKDLLENELTKKIPLADLPEQYRLAVLTEEKTETNGFYSNAQKDMLRGNHYALFFPKYRGFLFQKIVPQFIFSILLFMVILLSFYMVWQSLEKQRRLTALKNDFISNITHELKTPITTVGVAIEALSNFNAMQNPERTKEYLNISKLELNRLTILVDKVLKMSLFEKKEPELKIETFDLHVLLNEVLASMKLQFEKMAAKVNLDLKGSVFTMEGDRIHLTSVIYNLIDNALKYSPEHPEINLILEDENQQLRLSVCDKGIGISTPYLNKIFEKFFRVPSGDQHDIKGHGLGLSYVAAVINKHKGKITVESKKNIGSQFTISLPKRYE